MAKKGNIQLMENVFVVFMLIFIGMMALIFIGVNSVHNQRIAGQAEFEMEAMRIARSLQNLPEIQCTIGDDTISYCINWHKAEAFKKNVNDLLPNKELYFPILGRSTITIVNLHDDTDGLTIYENPLGTSMQAFHLPVLIEEIPGLTTLGYIKVEVPR